MGTLPCLLCVGELPADRRRYVDETEGNQVVVKLPESIVKRIVNICKDSDQSGEVTEGVD